MIDDLLRIGSAFDWISPTVAYIQDLANGPSHTFLIPFDGGWSGHELRRLLRRAGVGCWGLMVVNGEIMVTVRKGQAPYAQYLLERAGVPFSGAVRGQAGRPATRRRLRGRSRLWRLLD